MKNIRIVLNEKGQDLLEFALILAFCAAIVFALNSLNFTGAIANLVQTNVFDNVTRVYGLGTSYTEALNKWGRASDEEVLAASQEERLAADQAALLNIASHFVGMTRSEVEATVHSTGTSNVFITKFLEDPDGTGTYAPKMKVNKDTGELVATNNIEEDKTGGKIFNWLQGDFGDDVNLVFEDRKISFLVNEKDPSNKKKEYQDQVAEYSNTRYFFSNYTMLNGKGGTTTGDTTGYNATDPHGAGYTVKGYFTYEKRNGVDYIKSVEMKIDPGSANKGNDTTISSKGLQVKIESKNGTTTTYAQNFDTGKYEAVSINDAEKLLR